MDQMGEVDYAPGEPKGTAWHPHRGFETVTYMIDGVFRHQDSNGGGGLITNGDTQWMTAGGGILHIEAPPEDLVISGGLFHGFQLWVNLPPAAKMTSPRYQDIRAEQVALLVLGRTAARWSGSSPATWAATPARASPTRRSPCCTRPCSPAPSCGCRGGATSTRWSTCWPAPAPSAPTSRPVAHRPAGRLRRRATRSPCGQHRDQDGPSRELDILVLGGEPIREPVAAYGPFVMNTRDELVQAFEDFQAGRLGTIPAEPHPGHDVL